MKRIFTALWLGAFLLIRPADAKLPPSRLIIANDGQAEFIGVILENQQGCSRDGLCYLRFLHDQQTLWVIYHGGEGQVCMNAEQVKLGLSLRAGHRVLARGLYRRTKTLQIIDVCASATSHLQALAPDAP